MELPTASGKTELALELAGRFDAEIVGADSRQIYRDMPLGTAAPTPAQLATVPHHLVAFLDPRERYSAARFADDALTVIRGLSARGKRVIVVGGTGFYIAYTVQATYSWALSRAYDPVRARSVSRTKPRCIRPRCFTLGWRRAIRSGPLRLHPAIAIAFAARSRSH